MSHGVKLALREILDKKNEITFVRSHNLLALPWYIIHLSWYDMIYVSVKYFSYIAIVLVEANFSASNPLASHFIDLWSLTWHPHSELVDFLSALCPSWLHLISGDTIQAELGKEVTGGPSCLFCTVLFPNIFASPHLQGSASLLWNLEKICH